MTNSCNVTPKKVLRIDGDYDLPVCPTCSLPIDEAEDANCCSVCGQILDWGVDNAENV